MWMQFCKKSSKDFIQIINTNPHPTLLTEIKFASPSLGKIKTLTDPASIAKQMIAGGSKALSVLTQPHLFQGSPEYFHESKRISRCSNTYERYHN